MSGTLSHRSEGFSPRMFIQPCISTFSTFQIYLFHIFYVCFFKGPGEKLFGRLLFKNVYSTMHINFFNFSNLFVPYILCLFFKGPGEKLFGRVLFKNIIMVKGTGEKLFGRVLSKNILYNHAYQLFQLFKFICSIYFMFVFLKDLERNFLEGFSSRIFC